MAQSQPQGFLAAPPSAKGPGVLVLHAWWGLNDTIRAFCARLANSGFVTFAPDPLAENDQFEPLSNGDDLEDSLKRASRPVTFYHYKATGHWFFEPDRSDAYNQGAAPLAWDR